jgi:hypothetical protein
MNGKLETIFMILPPASRNNEKYNKKPSDITAGPCP